MSGAKGKVDNGQRLPVAFGTFEGEAGICEREEGLREVAMFASSKTLRKVDTGTINGVEHEVIKIADSVHVKGMVVLTVKAVA